MKEELKIGGCSFAAAILASFAAVLLGMCIFGLQLSQWTEWQGRIVGMAATIAGVAGALLGLRWALRPAEPGTTK